MMIKNENNVYFTPNISVRSLSQPKYNCDFRDADDFRKAISDMGLKWDESYINPGMYSISDDIFIFNEDIPRELNIDSCLPAGSKIYPMPITDSILFIAAVYPTNVVMPWVITKRTRGVWPSNMSLRSPISYKTRRNSIAIGGKFYPKDDIISKAMGLGGIFEWEL